MSAAFSALAISRLGARPVFADSTLVTLNLDPATTRPVHHPADQGPPARAPLRTSRGHGPDHGRSPASAADRGRGRRLPGRGRALQGPPGRKPGRARRRSPSIPPRTSAASGTAARSWSRIPGPRELRQLRNGGQSDRYRHETPGINSRLDEVQAAILRVGLRHLDAWTARRRDLHTLYARGLQGAGLVLPAEEPYAEAVHHLFVVRHPRRDALAECLRVRGVGTLVHYPIPLHLQPAMASLGGQPGDLPVAEKAAREVLSLPLHPGLSDAQAHAVVAATRDALHELGPGGGS